MPVELDVSVDTDELLVVLEDEDDELSVVLAEDGFVIEVFEVLTFVADGPTVFEVGQTITDPTFTATYSRAPEVATIEDSEADTPLDITSTPTAFTAPGVFTSAVPNATVGFDLAANASDIADTATVTFAWRARVFFGVSGAPLLTEAFIESLGSALQVSRVGQHAVDAGDTPAGVRVFWAAPVSFGTPTMFLGEIGLSGGMTQIGVVSVVNAYGVAMDYQLWQSNQVGLGALTLGVQ